MLVPVGAGVLLHLWAGWSMHSPVRLPAVLALLAGLGLAAVALFAHNALFREGGSVLAVLLILAGLGSVWVEARDSRIRAEVVECLVSGRVTVTHHPTFGEGAPAEKTLYHHPLSCPGGYPSQFAAERKVAEEGRTVRIAYDPAHRMDPVLESENTAHGSLVVPAVLLLSGAALSVAAIAAEGRDGTVRRRRSAP
ncbi:hypothetical protein VO63_09580 [Streptomyces showdoensis]|uniref:Uncharacterized protein n=1 Tax=Streptomyces showdoensis TaxID=68268 RepID=A0A2P2GRH2_STREW|nr:hypothetical protein VO63_09580 [Streptomyces showdoensis]